MSLGIFSWIYCYGVFRISSSYFYPNLLYHMKITPMTSSHWRPTFFLLFWLLSEAQKMYLLPCSEDLSKLKYNLSQPPSVCWDESSPYSIMTVWEKQQQNKWKNSMPAIPNWIESRKYRLFPCHTVDVKSTLSIFFQFSFHSISKKCSFKKQGGK